MKYKYQVFLLCIYFSSASLAFSKPISVDITRQGNDVLTKSLADALTRNIAHSIDFTMGSSQQSDLQLVITENVKVKKIANHVQLSYKVSFMSRQKILSVSVGSCWQEQMSECAEQILRDAKITVRPNP